VSAGVRPGFDAQDITIACASALLAQLAFVAAFSMPSPKLVQADISNDNAQPIAVSITPVLKLGTKNPTKLPSHWQRKAPTAAKTPPPAPTQAALPSPQAEKTTEAIPKTSVPDASAPPVPSEKPAALANPTAPETPDQPATAASTEGSEQGAASGTETDPLKARAVDMYKAQLGAWFVSHFQIRGKIPFDKLKTLHALVSVTVTADRRVGSVTVVKASGDSTFDGEVQAALSRIQSGGELPAPPPMYPDMLDKPFAVKFDCTSPKLCSE
jgi:outer membrane biosynthesis protein TonB